MTTKFYGQDRIELREVEDRIEELDSDELNEQIDNLIESDDATELVTLRELLTQVESDGDTLINIEDWKNYVIDEWQQVVEDSHLPDFIKHNIDWQGVADDLSSQYTSIDFDGENYLVV